MATGMALTMSFLYLSKLRPKWKYIIFPWMDQKTCFKSIITSNLIPIIIEPIEKNGILISNYKEI